MPHHDYPKHLSLAQLPTPLQKLSLRQAGDTYNLFVKRDDLTGLEMSGNKIRKLEFLLQEAQDNGAERVMTCGGLQSNHCRATAFAALRLGLKCTLVLRGSEPDTLQGNYFLDRLTGSDIVFVTPQQYENVDSFMASYAKNYSEPVYVIPEGGSNAVGAWGYLRCFDEILEQAPQTNSIVLASGSGGTHAGLLLGKLLRRSAIQVVSVNVADTADLFREKIDGIMKEFCKNNGLNLSWKKDNIEVLDGFVGPGYAQVDGSQQKLIVDLARQSGLVLDPVYTAKAFNGLLHLLQHKKLAAPNVVFLHTGGVFGLFAQWPEFVEYL